MFGRYLLVDRLSRGGMGELFLARHGLSGFEKRVVIKKVLPHLAADPEFLTRFIDEAQVAVKLQHANIAQVFEVGRVGEEYFLAIEHIDGCDLRGTLANLLDRGRRMPPEIALFIAREAANGLAYAHRRTDATGESLALVHCDISPPNVMMSFEGEVKLIDFGIAKSALRVAQTDPNRGFGKFGYMSPEQLVRGGKIDHRTDLYALGVVLYEMLTGKRLFETGDSPDYQALAKLVVKGVHPKPSDTAAELGRFDDLLDHALAPDPDQRVATAAELRDAIQAQLIEVAPTANHDHLASFIHELATAEASRAKAQVDPLALAKFQRELTQQTAATISLARSAVGTPSHRRVAVDPVTDRGAGLGASTRRWILGCAALATCALVTFLVLMVLRGLGGTALALAVPAPRPPDPRDEVVVRPLPAADQLPAQLAPPPLVTGAVVVAGDDKDHHHHHHHHDHEPVVAPAQPAAPSAGEVGAHFRAATREYDVFKASYGTRLESEWNDLAHYATFAESPDKLDEFDRKIREFRARMRAQASSPTP